MAAKERTKTFYDKIKLEYAAIMSKNKKDGISIFTQDKIIYDLAERFYRAPKTIENIIFNRVK